MFWSRSLKNLKMHYSGFFNVNCSDIQLLWSNKEIITQILIWSQRTQVKQAKDFEKLLRRELFLKRMEWYSRYCVFVYLLKLQNVIAGKSMNVLNLLSVLVDVPKLWYSVKHNWAWYNIIPVKPWCERYNYKLSM